MNTDMIKNMTSVGNFHADRNKMSVLDAIIKDDSNSTLLRYEAVLALDRAYDEKIAKLGMSKEDAIALYIEQSES